MNTEITTKMVRKWCRETYGVDWWNIPIKDRKIRKRYARQQLEMEARGEGVMVVYEEVVTPSPPPQNDRYDIRQFFPS